MTKPHLSGIAQALAAQGRHGDDMLIHVSKKELETLNNLGAGLGIHLTRNPATGLPEAFNWLGALGGVAGGVIGGVLTAGNPLGVAAGASLGSGAGTAAGGGSLKQSLTAGVISGITGFATAGLGNAVAEAGTQAAEQSLAQSAGEGIVQASASQTPGQIVQSGLTTSTGQNIASGTLEGAANSIAQAPQGADVSQLIPKGYELGSGQLGNQVAALQGNAPLDYSGAVGKVADSGLPTPSYGDKLAAGWDQITSSPKAFGSFVSDNAKSLITTGLGVAGIGAIPTSQQNSTIQTEDSNENPYTAEWYTVPTTGERRVRSVRKASGGEIYGQYDGVEEAADGGYIPGGGLNFAEGGTAGIGGLPAAITVPEGATPTEEGLIAWLNAAPKEQNQTGGKRRRLEEYHAAGGGVGDLGGYSDGGRLLKGPGDGISDNIPATIDNRRPARLADGEFVIPARAVSELGNGSTEAGSKQLYAMLDRIAAKRKKGSGLAYQANPRKLMPV